MDYDDAEPFGRGGYGRPYSPLDHMQEYAEFDAAETRRKHGQNFHPRKTLHEFTLEADGTTVVVFNTKVVIVKENGNVQEFARAQ